MSVTLPATDPVLIELREEIGDDTASQGLLPDGSNLDDDLLLRFYEREGNDIGRAAARAFEYLTRKWAAMPVQQQLGPETETLKGHDYFQAEATRLRQLHGYAPGHIHRTRSGSVPTQVSPL